MKKRLSLLLAMLAVLVSTAMADNTISADPLTIAKSGTADLSINLTNTDAIAAVQFKVTLPDGVSVAESTQGISYDGDGGEPYKPTNGVKVTLTDRTSNMMVVGNKTGDNTYIFVLISLSGNTIATGEGAIMKINFQTENAEVGEKNVTLSDIHLAVDGSSEDSSLSNVEASVTVSDILKGDVNGNGQVEVGDAVCILRKLGKKSNVVFIESAADINGNGSIEIGDAVLILKFLGHKINALTRGLDNDYYFQDPD